MIFVSLIRDFFSPSTQIKNTTILHLADLDPKEQRQNRTIEFIDTSLFVGKYWSSSKTFPSGI